MKNLSINLRHLLSDAKISENELARRTGVSQQIINRILSGENQNPKIATLTPLAHYFMISISQLIGEESYRVDNKINTNHLGWQDVPLIDFHALTISSLEELLLLKNKRIMVDIEPTLSMYATRLIGDSMEPKFSEGTLLIFDLKKNPTNGDFILMQLLSNEILVRQFFTKENITYLKCLNPKYEDYKLRTITEEYKCLGTLIQSRTDFVIR